ncbi:ATP-grasp domain-containing protein [Ruminococcus sp. JL13D9]|uniref:ATP-grasp domain-containing protein n=1 Tax=Ruminococcus sp. JL13D9 TaxID=3233381 RepID=UPI00389A6D03
MKPLREVTVLITAAGNVFMPGTTACLTKNGERKIRLIGADMNDDKTMLEMVDAYYPVPRGDDPAYIDVLLDICKKEKVEVVLPIMSVELNALAGNRDRFEAIGTKVGVSDIEALNIANDKLKLFDYLSSVEIPCAAYQAVHSMEELKKAVQALGYPEKRVCLKVTNGSGSRGFRILDASQSKFDAFMHQKPTSCFATLDEVIDILSEALYFPEMLVMEYLPGNEYTVDLLADHGKVLYNCCRKSMNMENSIMLDGIVEDNKAVKELCATVTESLGLDGNIGFDIRDREDGTPVIMECNPRITAGIPTFAAAGVNLPYLNVKRMIGEKLPICEQKYGTIVKRRWMEMYTEE